MSCRNETDFPSINSKLNLTAKQTKTDRFTTPTFSNLSNQSQRLDKNQASWSTAERKILKNYCNWRLKADFWKHKKAEPFTSNILDSVD